MQDAYDVLSDPEKRKQYDRFGERERPARPRAGTTFDFGDFDLGDIFGGLFGRGGASRQQPQRGQRGNDVEVEVRVSFEDALRGVQTTVPVELELACHTCHGTGAAPGTAPKRLPRVQRHAASSRRRRACSRCSSRARAAAASASIVETPCPTCHGTGRERRTKRYTVRIPAGVKDGTKIKLKGKGEAGYGGAPAGDLFVVTRVEPSKLYERRGDDLVLEVPVSFSTSRRSARTVEIPTPDGRVSLKVPAGSRGRQAAARQGPRRAAPEGRRPRRPARARARRGAEKLTKAAARGARGAREGDDCEPERQAVRAG